MHRRTIVFLASFALWMQMAAPSAAQTAPQCSAFDDSLLAGFTACNASSLTVEPASPTTSDTPYLLVQDASGASVVRAPASFFGDYTDLASGGCGALCWDVRIFVDDGGAAHLETAFPQVLLSTAASACPFNISGTCTARFVGATNITENGGSNPGWHRVCAPLATIGPLNPLPSNEYGYWVWADPACSTAADWNALLANVQAVYFPFDYDANVTDEVGFDNICLKGGQRDHLKCYKVGKDANFAQYELLLDTPQFGVEPDCTLNKRATEFCVPACKTVTAGAPAPISVAGQILTNDQICYKVRCQTNRAPSLLRAQDQFGARTLLLQRATRMCAPAYKLPSLPCGNSGAPQCDGTCPAGQACTNLEQSFCKNDNQPCLADEDCPLSYCVPRQSGTCTCSSVGNPTVKQCGVVAGAPACQGACPASAPVCRTLGEDCHCTTF